MLSFGSILTAASRTLSREATAAGVIRIAAGLSVRAFRGASIAEDDNIATAGMVLAECLRDLGTLTPAAEGSARASAAEGSARASAAEGSARAAFLDASDMPVWLR